MYLQALWFGDRIVDEAVPAHSQEGKRTLDFRLLIHS